MLDRLESWIARARALSEQIAQYPEPSAMAPHLAGALLDEMPVDTLLDTAKAISSRVFLHVLGALTVGMTLQNGEPVNVASEPLDPETAEAAAPLLEAARHCVALGNVVEAVPE